MIGLDTNVLVRYLTQDDARQSASATRLIETQLDDKHPGYVSLVVLIELYWVLERLYRAQPDEIADTVDDMLGVSHFGFQERETVQTALALWRECGTNKTTLPDLLITQLALKSGCVRVVSFDRAAVRSAGMTLLA